MTLGIQATDRYVRAMQKIDPRPSLQRVSTRKPATIAADQRELTPEQLERVVGGKIISIINSFSI
jgi:hypothetical protein